MVPKPDCANRVLAEKYRLLSQLGSGGMGSVWRAEHIVLRSTVAVKLMSPDLADSAEGSARFLREARAAAALRSPHVVQILDFGFDEDDPFIVMELLDGESLADRLDRSHGLSVQDTGKILVQVARAIGRAHEAGIIHRDLKPENIFIVRNDEDEVVKVLDFGIAKAKDEGLGDNQFSRTRSGIMLGTPYYMSPEQIEGSRTLSEATDVWSFGIIAYQCLLGRPPVDADTLGGLLVAICTRPLPVPSTVGRVPPGFDGWFARACAREPERRFPSIREAAAELRALCLDLAVALPVQTSQLVEQPTRLPPQEGPAERAPRASSVAIPRSSVERTAASGFAESISTGVRLSVTHSEPEPELIIPKIPLGRGVLVTAGLLLMVAVGGVFFRFQRWLLVPEGAGRPAGAGLVHSGVRDVGVSAAALPSGPSVGPGQASLASAAIPISALPVVNPSLPLGSPSRGRDRLIPVAAPIAAAQDKDKKRAQSLPPPSGSTSSDAPLAEKEGSGPCRLNFSSIPASNVILDGMPIGMTPKMDVPAAPGPHLATFVTPEGTRRRETFTCAPGEAKIVALRFGHEQDPGPPAVSAPPRTKKVDLGL